ncbi:MAG: low temperature requirement protein A [Rubrobacteraceae bacterium]|nr:low temperature requirement protein A [Rubrobacteraceae bacterium]
MSDTTRRTESPDEAVARRSRFVRPQAVRNLTGEQRSEERASTPLELFFDLCFVVAVAALARGLHDEPNPGGVLRFLGLFVPVWWSWMIFTWYATAFDNDDVPYRVTLFAAMLSMLGLAASVDGVGVEAGNAAGFVLAYAAMRLLLTGLYLRAGRHAPADIRPFVVRYAAGNALGAAIWLSSLLVPEPGRYAVWAVGLFVELLAPILAVGTLSNPRVSFHPRHIPERYGLFTIIVLGESVLAVALGTADTDWAPTALLTAALGFVVAACIWWLYFDHVGSSGIELGPRPAFYWGYGHFTVYAGIAAFGVGTQLAIEAAAETGKASVLALASAAPTGGEYDLWSRLVLAGGVALYLAGIAFVDRVNEGSAGDRTVSFRLATAAALVALAVLGAPLPPVVFAALVAAVLLALTVLESLREDSTEA